MKGNRIPVSENEVRICTPATPHLPTPPPQVVQEALEKKTKGDVVCAEDVVNQLYAAGPHFSAVAHASWPFKLSTPNGGLKYKNSHFIEGGDFGNRENLIKYAGLL